MIAYTMLGANDLEASCEFYDQIFEISGHKRIMKTPAGGQFYGKSPAEPMVCITKPYDEGTANFGNGTMVALNCESTEMVDAMYAKAMELGAQSEGEPGWRAPDIFYGAYFRDPEGNKLCACKTSFGG